MYMFTIQLLYKHILFTVDQLSIYFLKTRNSNIMQIWCFVFTKVFRERQTSVILCRHTQATIYCRPLSFHLAIWYPPQVLSFENVAEVGQLGVSMPIYVNESQTYGITLIKKKLTHRCRSEITIDQFFAERKMSHLRALLACL